MMARKPAARVRAILELFRPLVDEIVLAADRTGDPDTLAACADLAEKRFVIDPVPLNRRLGWLQSRCDCDWILRFDDDEAPSAALLACLRPLLKDRRPMQIAFTRRWLWESEKRWISNHPWSPDFQIRLVRNAPGVWRFPGEMHAPIEILGELRFVDAPIYHCELLLADTEARRAKRARYEQLRPGFWNGDFPVNWYYTPEDWDAVETSETPPEDLELISRVDRGASFRVTSSSDDSVPTASAREAERFLATRVVSDLAYDAHLELVRPAETVPTGVVREHEVVVTNLGDETWPWGDYPPYFRLGYRWLTRTGEAVLEGRCLFTENVEPGMTTRLLAPLEPPAEPGPYLLSLDVVHENVRWFGCEAVYPIEVTEAVAGSNGRHVSAAAEQEAAS
jgi:hypothetical protein